MFLMKQSATFSTCAVTKVTDTNGIRNYAKNDIEKLRRCAVPVPSPIGVFRQFLRGGVQ